MGGLLASLLPTAILGALAPLPVLIVVSFLMSPTSGLQRALGFTAALVFVFAVIGVVTLSRTSGPASSSPDEPSPVAGTILAVLGVLFLVVAVKQWVGAPDPDAAPPKFMTQLTSMSVGRATLLGLIVGVINVKQVGIFVGGVAQIVQADVTTGQRWTALLLLLVVIQAGTLGLVVVYLLARGWAVRQLERLHGFMVTNNRVIGIVLGLVIGVLFTIKGVAQIG